MAMKLAAPPMTALGFQAPALPKGPVRVRGSGRPGDTTPAMGDDTSSTATLSAGCDPDRINDPPLASKALPLPLLLAACAALASILELLLLLESSTVLLMVLWRTSASMRAAKASMIAGTLGWKSVEGEKGEVADGGRAWTDDDEAAARQARSSNQSQAVCKARSRRRSS